MSTPQPLANEAPAGSSVVASIVDDCSLLVSPPDVCVKISEMLASDSASADDFSDVIIRDTGLTARIMRVVNSPFYGLRARVDTVSRAVAVLGTRELSSIVYSLSAVQAFAEIQCELTNMNTFWRHAVYTGLTARNLATKVNVLHPERLFVAGILHDIGTLVINQRFPDVAATTIAAAEADEDLLYRKEQDLLGFDHAALAALMLEKWNLPATTCDAIRWHHDPELSDVSTDDAVVLHLADLLANYSITGCFRERKEEDPALDLNELHARGLPTTIDLDELLDEVDQQFVETIYLLIA